MKTLFKLCLVGLLLTFVFFFIILGRDDVSLASPDNTGSPIAQFVTSLERQAGEIKRKLARLKIPSRQEPVSVHKWLDSEGNWHFSDEENPSGSDEVIIIDPEGEASKLRSGDESKRGFGELKNTSQDAENLSLPPETASGEPGVVPEAEEDPPG